MRKPVFLMSKKAIGLFLWLVGYIVFGVFLFSRVNFEPSQTYFVIIISIFSLMFLYWLFRVTFIYKIVRRTNDTVYNSVIKDFHLREFGFYILGAIVPGLLLLSLTIISTFWITGALASFLPKKAVLIEATCDYSQSIRYYGVSNYLIDSNGHQLHVKANKRYCGTFGDPEVVCIVQAERNWFGDFYTGISC